MSDLGDLLDLLLADSTTRPGAGVDDPPWHRLVDTQLSGICLAEELGGPGGTLPDAFEVVARCGEAGLAVPIVETSLLAGWLATRVEMALPDTLVSVALSDQEAAIEASRVAGGWRLTATIPDVAWGGMCECLLVPASTAEGTLVAQLTKTDFVITPGTNLADEPRDTVHADVLVPHERCRLGASGLMPRVRLLASLGRSCQLAGAARRATRLAIEHVSLRHQFGRALAEHQVVAHMIAEMVAETAATEAAVAAGVAVLTRSQSDSDPPVTTGSGELDERFAVNVARVQSSRAADIVARHAHQVHAAIGITAEYPLHHLTRRLWAWPHEYGSPGLATTELSAMLLEKRNPWALLTEPSSVTVG